MAECKICGKANLNNMGVHLRKKHDMDTAQYEEWCNKEGSENNNETNNDKPKMEFKDNVLDRANESSFGQVLDGLEALAGSDKEKVDMIAVALKEVLTSSIENKDIEKQEEVPTNIDNEPIDDSIISSETSEIDDDLKDEENDPPIIGDVTPKEFNEMLFNHVERKDPDRPLSEFCKEYGIEEGDLINVVRQYLGLGEIPILQKIKNNESVGFQKAKKLAEKRPPSIRVTESNVAQSLEEDFGYEVVTVERPMKKGISPKTWVLKLKKEEK